jgi:hypothetical protein
MKGLPLTNAHAQHKINRRRDAAMSSPPAAAAAQPALRRNSHATIPCIPAAASSLRSLQIQIAAYAFEQCDNSIEHAAADWNKWEQQHQQQRR